MKHKIILVVASVCESLLNGKTMCLTLRTSSRMANASLISMLFVFGCSSSNEVQVASDELDSEDVVSVGETVDGESNENSVDSISQTSDIDSPTPTPDAVTGTDLEVENADPSNNLNDVAVLNESNALDIWREVVSVINEEQLNEYFDVLESELNINNTFNITNTIDDIVFSEAIQPVSPYQLEQSFGSGEFNDISEGERYTCASGGVIDIYVDGVSSIGVDSVFTDCVVSNQMLEGITYSGITGQRNVFRGSISRTLFRDFTRSASNGETVSLSGAVFGGNSSFVSIDKIDGWNDMEFIQTNGIQEFRLSAFNITRTTVDSETNVGITQGLVDGVLVFFNRYRLEESIEGRFNVFAPWTGTSSGLSVAISLEYSDDVVIDLNNPDLEFVGRDPIQPFNWESGSVTISAGDSTMVIRPSVAEVGSFELELSDGSLIGPVPWVNEFFINP